MEPAELSTVLKRFYVEARNVEGKPYSRNTMRAIRSGLDRFLSCSPQRKPFSIIRDKAFKPANEALDASLKDLARKGLISSTKHKSAISNEDLEALYAANQLGVNTPESLVNTAWFYTILYFGKRRKSTRDETRWLSAENNNKRAEVLRLTRESDEKSSRRSQRQRRRESVCDDGLARKSPLSRGLRWEVFGKKRSTMRCPSAEMEKPQCKPVLRWPRGDIASL